MCTKTKVIILLDNNYIKACILLKTD